MNDLEDRVRTALHDRADYQGVRTMPSMTRGQVRKREAWFVSTLSVVAVERHRGGRAPVAVAPSRRSGSRRCG